MQFSPDKIIVAGVDLSASERYDFAESMQEMKRLADTAGYQVVGELAQKRPQPDQKYFIGSGKLGELKSLVAKQAAIKVIFDNELSASQQRNLGKYLEVEIIDRPGLIIDIFSKHAHTREGKIQTELARLEYEMPRLAGKWEHLSRQRGGLGLRDVGEQQLELDRRLIRKHISELKDDIEKLRKQRIMRREKRKTSRLPLAALVGYTNSGKSTLLNALTNAGVLTQDQLFATLDPTTRRLKISHGQTILITDTVGFIQKLPHQLIAAFRATLEEVTEADVLLHVVDISNPHFEDQISAVYSVLEELKAVTNPIITIFNKVDKLAGKLDEELLKKYAPAVAISALHFSPDSSSDLFELFHQVLESIRL